jgi:4a-hydroxytetrahydrobiopterin dehydratase
MELLTENLINEKLKEIKGWVYQAKHIEKEFLFKDFSSALSFVNRVGELAEQIDHHPDLLIHSWNKVKIIISTHSKGGVTNKDFELAEKIEGLNQL